MSPFSKTALDTLFSHIDLTNIPSHIAVIMDGNGRWAKNKGVERIKGHSNAIHAVREITEMCVKLGVRHLTLFAFSTENWERPKMEIKGLMAILVNSIDKEIPRMQKNNIRFSTIGKIEELSPSVRKHIDKAVRLTKDNSGMELILALNYSGKWDILNAVKKHIQHHKEEADPADFERYLSTYDRPDPELLIRTSGEMRISNFMLWQLAYSELYFSKVMWPDFREKHLLEAIVSYQHRERRFGKISE